MHITQNYQRPTFNGKIIFNKDLEMAKAFKDNRTIIDLSNAGYDVIGTVSRRCAGDNDFYHPAGTYLYRLLIKIRKENSTLDKIKCALGLTPRARLSMHHHSDSGNCYMIENRINPKFVLRNFGIDLSSKK